MSNEKKTKKKREKWVKLRHKVVRNVLYCLLKPYSILKYGLKSEKFTEENGRQYLILYNHQTPFDQFFVGMSYKTPVYYVATEDIFSMGFVSKLIKYLAAPIPIKKQTADARAVFNCIKVAREGGSIAIAPEGNRTYSGKTGYIKPSVVSLIRVLKLPLVLHRLEGGYAAQPRWSDKVRTGGGVRSYVSRVIEYDEYSAMSDDELYATITEGLSVCEGAGLGTYRSRKSAEYLERAIYVCPKCGISELRSEGRLFKCTRCGITAEYGDDLSIAGVGSRLPFRSVYEWYDYQTSYINSMDVQSRADEQIAADTADLYEVVLYKRKRLVAKGTDVKLYGGRIEISSGGEMLLSAGFDDTSVVTVLGRNKLNIYYGGKVWQLKSHKRFCALKYMNIFYRYTNQKNGDSSEDFLGI